MPEDDRSVFILPRSLVYSLLTVVVISIGSGAWWGATVAGTMANLQRDALNTNQRITEQSITTDQRVAKIYADTNARFDVDEHKLDQAYSTASQIDLRLTRMETQLTFLVQTTSPGSSRR